MREVAELSGADFFGVGDLTPAREAILEQGGPVIARFTRSVSVGIALPHAIVEELPRSADPAVAMGYRRAYDTLNTRLDIIASHLAGIIQRGGCDAFPVPSSRPVSRDDHLRAMFSHKLAARLAGLGWIGKNCMLITPEVGPRARWVTVLTDAPLEPTGAPLDDRCGSCAECVNACPPRAFTGEPFRPGENREMRFNAWMCQNHLDAIEQATGQRVCGLCIHACPHGRRRNSP
jgi:epoxyqueuosine reductase QueG